MNFFGRDVLLSGGDALMISDEMLEEILEEEMSAEMLGEFSDGREESEDDE